MMLPAPLSPLTILLGVVAYHLAHHLLRRALKTLNPILHGYLSQDPRFRLYPYFVFSTSLVLAATLTTPSCLRALRTSITTDDAFPPSATTCLNARMTLYLAETPPLFFSRRYTTHHLLSILVLLAALLHPNTRLPRVLYMAYAGMVTGLVSDPIAILRIHGYRMEESALLRRLLAAKAVSVLLLRAVPLLMWGLPLSGLSLFVLRDWIWIMPGAFYAGYCVYGAFQTLERLGFLRGVSREIRSGHARGVGREVVAAGRAPIESSMFRTTGRYMESYTVIWAAGAAMALMIAVDVTMNEGGKSP